MHRFIQVRRRWLARTVVLVVLVGVAGCGGRNTPHPVQGKVVFPDGTPMKAGMVVFEPVEAQNPPVSARGHIQPDGSFHLSTFQPGDGAIEGRHRVLVTPPTKTLPWQSKSEGEGPAPPIIDPRFRSFDSSRLEFTVTPGQNDFTIVVKKPAATRP